MCSGRSPNPTLEKRLPRAAFFMPTSGPAPEAQRNGPFEGPNDLCPAVHTEHLHIVSLHHRNAAIERIGQLHVPEDRQAAFLEQLKDTLGVQGIAYLTTCNRVEFMMVDESYFCWAGSSSCSRLLARRSGHGPDG